MSDPNPNPDPSKSVEQVKTLRGSNDANNLPANAPQFAPQKHPLRFAILGKKHLIPQLKELVKAMPEIPDHWKAAIHHELDNTIKTNGAEIHLHVVDHANGGVSFQGHINPIELG